MSEQDPLSLDVRSGFIRHQDGTFGVWIRFTFAGRDDVESVQKVLADESGVPASFTTERDAQIAAFDWIQDIRRDALSKPPPGSTWVSEGEIERRRDKL